MLQFKEAIRKAQSYVTDVFESAAGKEMRLEGAELSDDTKFWTITFSYIDPESFTDGMPEWKLRAYKSVKLRAEDGEFFGGPQWVAVKQAL